MDPIEESVRRALEGGDPADQAFRRSIYAASARAMERLIAARGQSDAEAAAERSRVGEVLSRVEAEYAAYYGGDGLGTAVPASEDDALPASSELSPVQEPAPLPSAAPSRAPASYAPPAGAGASAPEGEIWKPGGDKRSAPRRRPGRSVLLGLAFLVALVLLLVIGSFLFGGGAEEGATPQAGNEATTQTAGAVAPAANGNPLSWIDVFSGTSLEQVSTPEGGRVTSVAEAGRSAIRVSAPDGGEGEILINLGPGLVGTIAGSQVRVELVAGSPDGQLREFSVRCLFAQASVCERQRFATAMREEAFVFDVPIPPSAGTPANLAIGPGLTAEGPDIDVYSVRMRVL